jgi:Arc/MetJ family transcription regulator
VATNLSIDEVLLAEALKAGGFKTKKATVNEALREFINRRRQADILKLFGTIDFDRKYDHKKARKRL